MRLTIQHDLRLKFANPLRVQVIEPPPELSGAAIVKTKLGGGFTMTAKGPHMAYVLPDGMQVALEISYVDAEGNEAQVDGAVEWSSANESVAHVIVEGSDGRNVTLLALALGTTQINAKVDADLGDGVKTLVTTMDVEVVAGEAVAGNITPVGEPEPIPK